MHLRFSLWYIPSSVKTLHRYLFLFWIFIISVSPFSNLHVGLFRFWTTMCSVYWQLILVCIESLLSNSNASKQNQTKCNVLNSKYQMLIKPNLVHNRKQKTLTENRVRTHPLVSRLKLSCEALWDSCLLNLRTWMSSYF